MAMRARPQGGNDQGALINEGLAKGEFRPSSARQRLAANGAFSAYLRDEPALRNPAFVHRIDGEDVRRADV